MIADEDELPDADADALLFVLPKKLTLASLRASSGYVAIRCELFTAGPRNMTGRARVVPSPAAPISRGWTPPSLIAHTIIGCDHSRERGNARWGDVGGDDGEGGSAAAAAD